MKSKMCASLVCLSIHGAVLAQQPAAPEGQEEAIQVVEVNGVKNPELKPYRQMLKGLDAFEKNHQMAPDAPLKFQLVSSGKELAFSAVTLVISGSNTNVPVPVSTDGTFTLPRNQAAADDNADLMSNQPKGLLRWRGDIHSPNVPADARRLGDLRLECEISWGVGRDDMPFLTRNSVSLLGGLCHSKMIGLRYQAPYPLASVTLVSGERRKEVPIDPKNRRVFWPPLADTSWDDDTLVVYGYAAPAAGGQQ